MIQVEVIDGRIEKAIRLLKLKCERDGMEKHLKRHAAYMSPGERRRKKHRDHLLWVKRQAKRIVNRRKGF